MAILPLGVNVHDGGWGALLQRLRLHFPQWEWETAALILNRLPINWLRSSVSQCITKWIMQWIMHDNPLTVHGLQLKIGYYLLVRPAINAGLQFEKGACRQIIDIRLSNS